MARFNACLERKILIILCAIRSRALAAISLACKSGNPEHAFRIVLKVTFEAVLLLARYRRKSLAKLFAISAAFPATDAAQMRLTKEPSDSLGFRISRSMIRMKQE